MLPHFVSFSCLDLAEQRAKCVIDIMKKYGDLNRLLKRRPEVAPKAMFTTLFDFSSQTRVYRIVLVDNFLIQTYELQRPYHKKQY